MSQKVASVHLSIRVLQSGGNSLSALDSVTPFDFDPCPRRVIENKLIEASEIKERKRNLVVQRRQI